MEEKRDLEKSERIRKVIKFDAKFYLTCVLTILAILLSLKDISFWPSPPGYGDIEINGDYVIPNVLSVDIARAVREAGGVEDTWELLTTVPFPKHTLWKDVKVYNIESGTAISVAGLRHLSVSNTIKLKDGVLVYMDDPPKGVLAQIESELEYITEDSGLEALTGNSCIRFIDEGYYIFNASSKFSPKALADSTIVLNVVCDGMPHVQKPLVAEALSKKLSEPYASFYMINGNIFLKVRDLAKAQVETAYGFEITWDKPTNTINFVLGEEYTEIGTELNTSDDLDQIPIKSTSEFRINGEKVKLTAYVIENEIYIKYRDLLDYGLARRYTQEETDDILFMNEIIETARSLKAESE